MVPRPHLSFCACKTSWLASEILVSIGPRPHLTFCAFKLTWLASELLNSMGSSPHLWLLHAKQRLLNQNYKSLLDPALICVFCMQNNNFRTWITSLYGSQTSPMVFSFKTATLAPESLVSIVPTPHLLLLYEKQRLLDQNYKSLWVPALICGLCMQNSNFRTRITSL